MDEKAGALDFQQIVNTIMNTTVEVITKPVDFYRGMPKVGGYVDPVIFMVVMGVISGLIRTVISLFGLGGASAMVGFAALVVVPIFVVIFGFVGAAILFVIWKALGSQESYETAFRCGAYAAAISPITALLGFIPYLGGVIGIAWMSYLMIVASSEVHGIEARRATIVFGVIGAVLALGSLTSEITTRRMVDRMSQFERNMSKMNEMTPEEAGKKMGEFMKGFQEGSGQK